MKSYRGLVGSLVSIAAMLGVAGNVLAAEPLSPSDLRKTALEHFEVTPSMVPAVKGTALTRAKLDLGKMMHFDARRSASALLARNTCHELSMGCDDQREALLGACWKNGT